METASTAPRTRTPSCVVHIGYHRAASSFLQLNFFSLLGGYLGPAGLNPIPGDVGTVPRLDTHRRSDASAVIVSDENLSGDLDRDWPTTADAIHARNPHARILIVVRSQYAIFRAFYFLYVKSGGTQAFEAFVSARAGKLFIYRTVVERYRTLFGPDNVYVMLQEDLIADGTAALRGLLAFIGADSKIADRVDYSVVKPSANDATVQLLRYRNIALAPIFSALPNLATRIARFGLPIVLTEPFAGRSAFLLPTGRLRPLLREVYAEDNAALFAMLGKDITAYDYPQPGHG